MATKFKNVITEIDTTGSNQTILTCPAGKTIIVKTMSQYAGGSGNVISSWSIKDNSEDSSDAYTFFAPYTTTDNYTINNDYPFILEENDVLYFKTDVADQHLHISYAEIDAGTKQRYRGIVKNVTTIDSYVDILTVPTGSTCLADLLIFKNNSTSATLANELSIEDSSASATKLITSGTLGVETNTGGGDLIYPYMRIFESGDKFKIKLTTSGGNATVSIFYLEIRNPPTRA